MDRLPVCSRDGSRAVGNACRWERATTASARGGESHPPPGDFLDCPPVIRRRLPTEVGLANFHVCLEFLSRARERDLACLQDVAALGNLEGPLRILLDHTHRP